MQLRQLPQPRRLKGAVNAPLGENGAVRISGNVVNDRNGYNLDGTSDNKSQAHPGADQG